MILISVFAILSGLWYAFFYKTDSAEVATPAVTAEIRVPSETPTITPKPVIFVHICGSVNSPGVVQVEKGSRLVTAIETAGGFNAYADRAYLNLAKVLTDGERIYVPSLEETDELRTADRIAGTGIPDVSEEGLLNGKGAVSEKGIININKATAEELTALPGIGESKARDIVAYRTKAGVFEKKEDIKNVSGIGDSLFFRIADLICVE